LERTGTQHSKYRMHAVSGRAALQRRDKVFYA
jgi:hypothetical protein